MEFSDDFGGGIGFMDEFMGDGQTLGGQAEKIGTQLDEATDEFLAETKSVRTLQITPGQDQLTAMEYLSYLNIDPILEPELSWIAREMLAAPMPPGAEQKVAKSGVVYFHDLENDYYTLEHPLTQRYLKVIERQRVDLLCLRTKPSINGLMFAKPEVLFHNEFRHLQIPCQSCGVLQSTLKCNQCLMSFCQACFDAMHKESRGPRKNHTTVQTAYGSLCSECGVKKPQVYCANCEDYFCFSCFAEYKKSRPAQATWVRVSDGEVIEPQKICEECGDKAAAFACDYCLDNFCVSCFWNCHFNGHRRTHTASKVNVLPMCNQCTKVRATVFCEQTQELMCTECFTMTHHKGNRKMHLFMDAMDLLVLLERLDPSIQEHMRRCRPRVLWAISQLQGWTRGLEARRNFNKRKELATQIQRRWRGLQARRKLLGTLNMNKWRRRQVNSYFLPRTSEERRAVKQKVAAMLAAKDVTQRAANASLDELRQTILETANKDPMEEINRTKQTLTQGPGGAAGSRMDATGGFPGAAKTTPSFPTYSKTYKSYEQQTGFTQGGSGAFSSTAGEVPRIANMSKDIRASRDTTLRQMTRLDGTS